MQDKNFILNKILLLLSLLEKYQLKPVWGAEIEFYLLGVKEEEISQILQKIEEKLGKNIEKEKGFLQYEIVTEPAETFATIKEVSFIQKTLLTFKEVSLSPKPYPDDYGSALHFHLSLSCGDQNLFNEKDQLEENQLLIRTINGILTLVKPSLYLITGDDPDEFLRLANPLLSPSHISWGKNNRSTVIRIPDSPPGNRNRRIEFRLASAQSEPELIVLFLLTGILYGIKTEIINLHPCLYGLSQDPQYNLEKLSNLDEAREAFCFWQIFEELCRDI